MKKIKTFTCLLLANPSSTFDVKMLGHTSNRMSTYSRSCSLSKFEGGGGHQCSLPLVPMALQSVICFIKPSTDNGCMMAKSLSICSPNLYPNPKYHTGAIISRGLYNFYPIFHCGLYCRAISITDNLCTKQGNSSIFEPIIRGL